LFRLSQLNLNAGYWDFFWPQFIQGISLAMLFVPLTTISMSGIPRESMGNATSLFNLLRNLGGGIGIAGVTTLVSRHQQMHINVLGANVTSYSAKAQAMLTAMQHRMQANGSGVAAAKQQSAGMLFGMLQRQATILSYIDVFQILAVIFLLMTPLVLLMRKPGKGAPAPPVH